MLIAVLVGRRACTGAVPDDEGPRGARVADFADRRLEALRDGGFASDVGVEARVVAVDVSEADEMIPSRPTGEGLETGGGRVQPREELV